MTRTPSKAIDGSGLSSDGTTHGVNAAETMWMGRNTGNAGGANFAKWFVVGLGAVYRSPR